MSRKAKPISIPSKTGKKSTGKKSSTAKERKKETKTIAKRKKVTAPKAGKTKKKIESIPIESGVFESEQDIIHAEFDQNITDKASVEEREEMVREEIVPAPVDNISADDQGINEPEITQDENLSDEEIQLVCFNLNYEEFGIDINNIKEINRSAEVTKIVDAPVYVKGVIDLRGSIIPVIDLRTRMGYPEQDDDKNTRIIVLDYNNNLAGIKVDAVTEVVRLKSSQVENAPEKAKTQASRFLKGIFKKEDNLILIIDGQKLT
ncbi:MAG: chemotaxis protein CheW [candidate division Zixibacteria bacterium]